jgi:3-deoxy-manno-octulosonate cytidylyltransferase (CMP-KDO synthetase)
VSRILVATDSGEISQAVKKAGFEAVMTPESLKSGTDRVAFVAKDLKEKVIINVQGDEPVVPPEAVEAAMGPVLHKGDLMGSVFTPFRDIQETFSPANVKVITDANKHAIYFSRHPIPFRQNPLSDQEILQNPNFGKHLGIYVYQKDFLLKFASWDSVLIERAESLEQLRALYNGVKIGMGFSAKGSQSVDTAEDLEKARSIFRDER